MSKMNIGIIGCGSVSEWYFGAPKLFRVLKIVACADIRMERAREKAAKHNIRWCTVTEMLADPSIQLVINLTPPQAHAEISIAVLEAGKHLYTEKPLAITRADAVQMIRLAEYRGMRISAAPDTFMGGAVQTCRQLIDEGAIGKPIAAMAFMLRLGVENWHPDPAFLFQRGGGPLFDMGPYYLTVLINLLGPIRLVTGIARITFPKRQIAGHPGVGAVISVETPTHLASVLEFSNGTIATLVTSFDLWSSRIPFMEIHGSEGALSIPDPSQFGGTVLLRRVSEQEWHDVPITHGYTEQSRGIGIADMVYAIREGRPHRASAELAYHVLDTMVAIEESSEHGMHIKLASSCLRPAPLPSTWPEYAEEDTTFS